MLYMCGMGLYIVQCVPPGWSRMCDMVDERLVLYICCTCAAWAYGLVSRSKQRLRVGVGFGVGIWIGIIAGKVPVRSTTAAAALLQPRPMIT